ncbi:uncharacterized protein [Eurosta solidaginis]|uniref:uncharacterized protein isoform X1 n=1 Tax=Eurosta solidaginis TaxID=178769 RepID=UPI003530655A
MADENWNLRSTGARQRISDEEIRAILNASESSNDLFSGDDDVDIDMDYIPEVESDHGDYEDIGEGEDFENDIEISGNQSNFQSKSKDIVWHTTPSPYSLSRSLSENIIHGCMGVTSYAIHRISNITDSSNICFTSAMKQVMIKFTNMEGKRVYKDSYVEFVVAELDAYLGVLLLIVAGQRNRVILIVDYHNI